MADFNQLIDQYAAQIGAAKTPQMAEEFRNGVYQSIAQGKATPTIKDAIPEGQVFRFTDGGVYQKSGNKAIPISGYTGSIIDVPIAAQNWNSFGTLVQGQYGIQAGQTKEQGMAAYDAALNDSITPRVTFQQNADGSVIQGSGTTISGTQALAQQQAARNAYNRETLKVTPYGYQETPEDLANKARMEAATKNIPIGLANAPKTQPKYVTSYKGNSVQDFLTSAGQDGSYANRAKLALEQGITGYKGTAEQNLLLLSKLRGATSSTLASEPSTVNKDITADSLKGATGTTMPNAPAPTGAADATVAGAATTLAEIMKQLTPATTPEDAKQQSLLDQMTSLVGEAAKKSADQLTAEQSAGLPDLKKQFADINGQILTKSAEYNVLQAANANKPITMNSIIGNERAILNAKAADIGLLTARAQALQGQIEVAQDTVNRAIDLKYDTKEKQLDILQAQLNALQPTLTKQEKLQATAQQLLIDQQKQELADIKAKEKEKSDVILGMISDYPDAGITFTDSLSQAQAKLSKSRIYQDKVRAPVSSSSTSTTQNQEVIQQAQQKITLADEILKNYGQLGAVGPNALARFDPVASLTGAKSNFIASVQQLVNQETLASLLNLKKAGGTLGALNESEGQMLRDAASKINNWAIKNKDGKVTGYNAAENDFRKEIERIKTLSQKAITDATKNTSDPLGLGINANPLGLDLGN